MNSTTFVPTTINQAPDSSPCRSPPDIRASLRGDTGAGCVKGNLPALDAEVEKVLWRRWRDSNDTAAACGLAAARCWLVTSIVARYHKPGLSSGELMIEAWGAVMRAICRFDPGWPTQRRAAEAPTITMPIITYEGDANEAPHPDADSYAKQFSGRYAHPLIKGGTGHKLPQEAPRAFAQAVIEVGAY